MGLSRASHYAPNCLRSGVLETRMSYVATSVGATAPPVVREWYKLKQMYRYTAMSDFFGWLWTDRESAKEILRASSQNVHWRGEHATDTGPWSAWSFNCKVQSMEVLVQRGWMVIYKNKVFKGWFFGNCDIMRYTIAWMNNHLHRDYKLAVCHAPSATDPSEYCLSV